MTTASASYEMDGDTIVVCFERTDLTDCMKVLHSPAAAEAMDFDGILCDTVKRYVLGKELKA